MKPHGGTRKRPEAGYDALVDAIRSVPDSLALDPKPTGRPRKPTDDPRVARRRAQYRNAQHRKHGRPLEPVPPATRAYIREAHGAHEVSVWLGSHWVPALIDVHGRRIFLGRAA